MPKAKIYLKQAFQFSEKAKSTILLESFYESRAKKYSDIPDSLLMLERKLKVKITDYTNILNIELLKKEKADSTKILQYERKLFSIRREHLDLMGHFTESYPKYNQHKYQVAMSPVDSIITHLDNNEALIEYLVGDSNIFIFAITHDNFSWEKVAIDAEFKNQLNAYLHAIKKIESENFAIYSRYLYKLLIQPIYHKIKAKGKLNIIPDGILNYLPFETLISNKPLQSGSIDFSGLNYLINDFTISYHFSSTLWLNELKNKNEQQSRFEFVGYAPVFYSDSTNGYILAHNKPFVDSSDADNNMRSITANGKYFNTLPYSEEEVESIFNLCKEKGKEAKAYFHAQATEGNFKNDCKDYRIIHVASHAFYNKSNPALSGVAFSQEHDNHHHTDISDQYITNSESVEDMQKHDGILYIGETYNLNLNADLLVLSACETGIGEFVRGEGVMSMTRGFLYSGARNIIISLWKIDDRDSKELMVDMYRHYFSGASISTSLRNAKLKLIKNPETSFPKYWSGFVLVGE